MRAFQSYWSDRRACLAALRSAVEAILTQQGIKRYYIQRKRNSVNGRRVNLPLHRRIEVYRDRNISCADMMMALKWVGNEGSHDDNEPSRELVLESFDILRAMLFSLYDETEMRVARSTKRINARRGSGGKQP
jgi:hypothetical protein